MGGGLGEVNFFYKDSKSEKKNGGQGRGRGGVRGGGGGVSGWGGGAGVSDFITLNPNFK